MAFLLGGGVAQKELNAPSKRSLIVPLCQSEAWVQDALDSGQGLRKGGAGDKGGPRGTPLL